MLHLRDLIKWNRSTVVGLVAGLSMSFAAISDDNAAYQYFKSGKDHYDAGRYAQAIRDLESALDERAERNGFIYIETGEMVKRQVRDEKGVVMKDANGRPLYEEVPKKLRHRYQPKYYLNLAKNKRGQRVVVQQVADAAEPVDFDPVDKNIPNAGASRPGSIAYVIGNSEYHNLANVDYAVRDARLVKKYLDQAMGYEKIKVKENLNRIGFSRLFGSATTKYKTGELYQRVALEKQKNPNLEVFIYYAGHGAPSLRENGKPYIVPVDASLDYLEEEAYPLSDFYGALAALGEEVKLTVVIDSCFSGNTESGALHKGISPAALKTVSTVGPTNLPNASIFTSAKANEVSYWFEPAQNSLFTHYFLKGMQNNNADKDGDGKVTHGELFDYVSYEVSAYTLDNNKPSKQTPGYTGSGKEWLAVGAE